MRFKITYSIFIRFAEMPDAADYIDMRADGVKIG